MRTLFLVRHCKSSWAQVGVADVDRKLTPRGKRDALALGSQLWQQEPAPDLVVTSHARRAQSTAKRMASTWGYAGQIQIDTRLYEGTQQGSLMLLQQLDDAVGWVVLVGHNPHLEAMVFMLGGGAMPMATGTAVRIGLAIDRWADLRLPAEGSVERIYRAGSDAA